MRERLEAFLDELGQEIESSVRGAHDRYRSKHGDEVFVVGPGTKASLICDYIYENLRLGIGDSSDVRFFKARGARFISLHGEFLIRVKKLSPSFKPKINQTDLSHRFNCQLDLLGMPKTTHIYLGYVMDKHSGTVDKVVLICPGKDGIVEWFIDLSKPSEQFPELFPVVETPAAKRIRIPGEKKAQNG